MKTSAILAAKVNGKYIATLLRHDAEPETLLPILGNYSTFEKAIDILTKGTIDSLEETLEESSFVGNDIKIHRNTLDDVLKLAVNSNCKYLYYFAVNKWIAYSNFTIA